MVIRGSQPNRVRERRELGDALNGKIAILNGKDERTMLKKTIRRLGALAMVLAMAVSVFAVNASAENSANDAKTFKKAFTKTVTTDGNTCAPNTTFTYEVTKASAVNATITDSEGEEHTYVTKAGNADDDVALSATQFTPGEETKDSYVVNGDITVKAGAYTTPGIYHYTVKEAAGSYEGITYATTQYDLYVFAEVDANGKIQVTNITAVKDGQKADLGFVNDYGKDNNTTHDVKIVKEVTGNMGDKANDEFNFTVSVNGHEGEMYKVVYAATSTAAPTTPTYVTSDSTITIEGIKDTGYIQIFGLTADDTYTVTEDDYSSSGYKTYVDGTEKREAKGHATEDNTVVTVENKKDNTAPTGVIMTIAPYALMVVLAGAFAVVFLTRRNRAE